MRVSKVSFLLRFYVLPKRSNKIGLSEFELDTCTATFRHIPTNPRTERLQEILEHQQQSRRKTKNPFFLAFAKASAEKDAAFWWKCKCLGFERLQCCCFGVSNSQPAALHQNY